MKDDASALEDLEPSYVVVPEAREALKAAVEREIETAKVKTGSQRTVSDEQKEAVVDAAIAKFEKALETSGLGGRKGNLTQEEVVDQIAKNLANGKLDKTLSNLLGVQSVQRGSR